MRMIKSWDEMQKEMMALMAKRYKPNPNRVYNFQEEETDEEYRERIAEEQSYMRDKI